MRIIRASECRSMPWKNGGGTTTEIAIAPQGASLDSFDWRISTAHVGADGPFSAFPDIDRTLSVLNGNGIVLAFGDGETVRLERTSEPCAFAADRPVEGRLLSGPIDDLNVMTRRGRWSHQMTRLTGPGPIELAATSQILILVANANRWTLTDGSDAESLGTGDSAMLDRGEAVTLLSERDGDAIYAIALTSEAPF
jgi:environmental stress-induced protein Ves